MIIVFVLEIFKFSYYANLATDDVIGCASTVVRHKIKNISANNEAMLLKLSRDVAPYKIYQRVYILMLLWQHAQFQSPASSKLTITICDSTRQNNWSYLRRMPVPPSLGLLFNIINCIFCPVQLQMVIFDSVFLNDSGSHGFLWVLYERYDNIFDFNTLFVLKGS